MFTELVGRSSSCLAARTVHLREDPLDGDPTGALARVARAISRGPLTGSTLSQPGYSSSPDCWCCHLRFGRQGTHTRLRSRVSFRRRLRLRAGVEQQAATDLALTPL